VSKPLTEFGNIPRGMWMPIFIMFMINGLGRIYCQQFLVPDSLVNKTHAQRTLSLSDFYEQGLVNLDSITIFSIIDSIQAVGEKVGDSDLILEGELMKAHYFVYRDYFSKDFVVDKIKNLDQTAKEENILWLEIRTQSLLGNYFYFFHSEYGQGFEHLARCVQLLGDLPAKDYPLKQICLYQLANVHYTFQEYDIALKYLLKATQISSGRNSYYYSMAISNMLGLIYRIKDSLELSDYYFQQILEQALEAKDTVWQGILSGNLGDNLLLRGEVDKAVPLLEKDVTIAERIGDWGLASSALVDLAEIELDRENLTRANELANKAYSYAHKSNSDRKLASVYPLLSKIYAHSGHPDGASLYLDSALLMKNKIADRFDAMHLTRAQQRIDLENQKRKEQEIKTAHDRRIQKRNLLIAVLAIIMLLTSLFFNRWRHSVQLKQQRANAEKEAAKIELNFANQRINY